MLIVHPMIWMSMLTIAFRFHKLLVIRERALNPPRATPAPDAEVPSGVEVV